MQLWHRPILASVALLAAATASAQVALNSTVFTKINSSTTWVNNNGAELGDGTPISGTTLRQAGLTPPYTTSISGTGNSDATTTFSSFSAAFTNSPTYDKRVWISFSAVATRPNDSAYLYDNLKLLQGTSDNNNTNSNIVVGVGSVKSDSVNPQYWGVGYGLQSGSTPPATRIFGNVSLLGGQTPMTTSSYILMQIDFNSGTNADVFSIWRSASPFELDVHGAPTNFSTLGAAATNRTNDFNFDRISIYAGAGSTFYLSDITITAEIPEPSTYTFALGTGVLALVGYRRYSARKAA